VRIGGEALFKRYASASLRDKIAFFIVSLVCFVVLNSSPYIKVPTGDKKERFRRIGKI
jgi:hypothetical protein